MKTLSFVWKRLFSMNYRNLFRKINQMHKKTGHSRLWLLMDIQRCALRHGAGYMDYEQFEMYNLNEAQRRTYLTRARNNELVKKYNDPQYIPVFHYKDAFNARFNSYLDREWALLREKEKALDFLKRHDAFIIKPLDGSCGKGVRKLRMADFPSPEAAYDSLWESCGNALLEELIVQHPAVSAIYPDAINTVRAVTLYKDGTAHVIATCFRIGNNGSHVDNLDSGGMVVPVDEKTGIVGMRAMDKDKVAYTCHPSTGTPIQGFRFPDWDKAMDLVRRAAGEIPQVGYMGWDVAFSIRGPILVEGNEYPGNGLFQLPEHTPDKIGMMPKFDI